MALLGWMLLAIMSCQLMWHVIASQLVTGGILLGVDSKCWKASTTDMMDEPMKVQVLAVPFFLHLYHICGLTTILWRLCSLHYDCLFEQLFDGVRLIQNGVKDSILSIILEVPHSGVVFSRGRGGSSSRGGFGGGKSELIQMRFHTTCT